MCLINPYIILREWQNKYQGMISRSQIDVLSLFCLDWETQFNQISVKSLMPFSACTWHSGALIIIALTLFTYHQLESAPAQRSKATNADISGTPVLHQDALAS